MQHEEIERRVGRTPDVVFDWLTVPGLLTRWWPDDAEVELCEGGDYRLHWSAPDVTLRGTYRTVDRPGRLAFTWHWVHEDLPPRLVEIELYPDGDDTVVHVRHEAASDAEGADYRAGWEHFLGRLDDALTGD